MSTTLTPYMVISQLNTVLAELGEAPKPPQMGYNYSKKGMLGEFVEVDGKRRYTQEAATAWIAKFLKKNYNVDVAVEKAEPALEMQMEDLFAAADAE